MEQHVNNNNNSISHHPLQKRLISPYLQPPPTLQQRANTATRKYIKKMGMNKNEIQMLRKFGSDHHYNDHNNNHHLDEWKQEVSDALIIANKDSLPPKTSPIRNIVTPDAYKVSSSLFTTTTAKYIKKRGKNKRFLNAFTSLSKNKRRASTTGNNNPFKRATIIRRKTTTTRK